MINLKLISGSEYLKKLKDETSKIESKNRAVLLEISTLIKNQNYFTKQINTKVAENVKALQANRIPIILGESKGDTHFTIASSTKEYDKQYLSYFLEQVEIYFKKNKWNIDGHSIPSNSGKITAYLEAIEKNSKPTRN